MTTKEKAKAYDEALKRAKFYHGNCPSEPERKKLEKMFPVLHESEDEKIRKHIVEILNRLAPCHWDGNKRGECLAWLEKQKDASEAIEAVERIDNYIAKHTANAHDMDDSNPDKKYYQGQDDALGKIAGILQDVYTKNKEQKPIPKFKVGDCIYDKKDSYNRNVIREVGKDYYINAFAQKMDMAYTDANFEFLEHLDNDLNDSKPAEWSEEDEETLKDIIRSVTGFDATTGIISQNFKQHEKKINFLKNLHPQPKCEWSEEAEKDIQEASNCLRDYAKKCVQGENSKLYIQSLADRIESLRPQPHWKPSEKQINMLGVIVEREKEKPLYGIDGYSPAAVLESLYNDLKKLM